MPRYKEGLGLDNISLLSPRDKFAPVASFSLSRVRFGAKRGPEWIE